MNWPMGIALALGGFVGQWLVIPTLDSTSYHDGFIKGVIVFFITLSFIAILRLFVKFK